MDYKSVMLSALQSGKMTLSDYCKIELSNVPSIICGIDPITQFNLVDNIWQLSVKLPGVTKEQISVEVKIDKVEITIKEDTEFYKEGYQEVYYLPDNSKQKSLKANMKNGVLTLIMNKKLEDFKVKVD